MEQRNKFISMINSFMFVWNTLLIQVRTTPAQSKQKTKPYNMYCPRDVLANEICTYLRISFLQEEQQQQQRTKSLLKIFNTFTKHLFSPSFANKRTMERNKKPLHYHINNFNLHKNTHTYTTKPTHIHLDKYMSVCAHTYSWK